MFLEFRNEVGHQVEQMLSELKPLRIADKNAPTMRIRNPDLDTGDLTKGLGNIPPPAYQRRNLPTGFGKLEL
jgi:hypothetical protein